MDLALNNLQRLICHKTKLKPKPKTVFCYLSYLGATDIYIAQSAEAVEYTDCTSAEG